MKYFCNMLQSYVGWAACKKSDGSVICALCKIVGMYNRYRLQLSLLYYCSNSNFSNEPRSDTNGHIPSYYSEIFCKHTTRQPSHHQFRLIYHITSTPKLSRKLTLHPLYMKHTKTCNEIIPKYVQYLRQTLRMVRISSACGMSSAATPSNKWASTM